MNLMVKKLVDNAVLPTKNHETDAGFDLYTVEDVVLPPGVAILVETGIAVKIPDGYAGFIWDRSGLGSKGIHRFCGVIDSGYTGPLKVCLFNSRLPGYDVDNDEYEIPEYFICAGARIAQLVIQEVPKFKVVEVTELPNTERGSKGFGSSGK